MSLKHLFALFATLLLASIGWRYHDAPWLTQWLRPAAPPVPIVFDNGTVRQKGPVVAAPDQGAPPGVMRKCQSAKEVVYTDTPCPKGSQEMAVGGNVTVVAATKPPPKPAATQPDAKDSRPKTLMDVLDPTDMQKLKDKHMEKVINH